MNKAQQERQKQFRKATIPDVIINGGQIGNLRVMPSGKMFSEAYIVIVTGSTFTDPVSVDEMEHVFLPALLQAIKQAKQFNQNQNA